MSAPENRRHLKVAAACTGFVMLMVGVSFAAVPLYDLFCRVTGFGGTPRSPRPRLTGFSTRR